MLSISYVALLEEPETEHFHSQNYAVGIVLMTNKAFASFETLFIDPPQQGGQGQHLIWN